MTIVEFLTARYDEAEEEAGHSNYRDDAWWMRGPFDADFVLADLASKRVIVARMAPYCWEPKGKPCGVCDRLGCATLRDLAQPFAEHPDYDPAWAVAS